MFKMAGQSEDLSALSVEELRTRLEVFGLSLTGSKAHLRERLRGALETAPPEKDEFKLTSKQIEAMKKTELVNKLNELSLKSSGNKDELKTRLKAALEIDDEVESLEDEEEDDFLSTSIKSDDEETVPNASARRIRVRESGVQPMLTYRDVEDALETYSGDGSKNFERWVTNFEETADMCKWTDTQKVIYAKRLLRGSAKLFVNFECSCKTWKELKKSLKAEFATTANSKDVHRQLSLVRKQNDESFQEYIYRVLDIASHAEIEQEAKIQYIIDGIKDAEVNKVVLYGATTIKELRKKFVHYEALVNKMRSRNQNNEKTGRTNASKTDSSGKRCYNCGEKNHISKECLNKAKGVKCFSCGEFGHIASKCSKTKASTEKDSGKVRCDAVSSLDKKTYKIVNIMGQDVKAILDSGSD